METAIELRDISWNPSLIGINDEQVFVAYRLAITKFLSELDVKDSTKRTYWDSLKQWQLWLRKARKDIRTLDAGDVKEYKEYLKDKGLTTLTVNSYMMAVKMLYGYFASERVYPDITTRIKVKRSGEEKAAFVKMHLTEAEQMELLEHFRSRNLRDYAIVALMLGTGLRVIEIVRLEMGDLQVKRGRNVFMVHGKGRDRKDEVAVLRDDVYRVVCQYRDCCRKGANTREPFFVTLGLGHHVITGKDGTVEYRTHSGNRMSTRSVEGMIKKGLRAIGLDSHEYSSHSLRHSFAVNLLRAGVPMDRIQKAMRHASIDTTMIYLQSIAKDERLDSAPELEVKMNFKTGLTEQ